MFLRCGPHTLDLSQPCVMGVLNVTPDSFSDGGAFVELADAVRHAERLAAEGAAIIDIGGESTRPRAKAVSVEEELRRVMPVISAVVARVSIPVSVDTSKPEVMSAAVAAGASMINDVRALTQPGALQTAASLGVPVCLMHMQGEPATMQDAPTYGDVVAEVKAFLQDRIQACCDAGLPREQLLIDPGFGFGKTLQHNLSLLAGLRELNDLGLPLVVGLSRKSMIGQLTGRAVGERLAGSIALAVLAAERGARIVRAHDVAETRDALRIVAALSGV